MKMKTVSFFYSVTQYTEFVWMEADNTHSLIDISAKPEQQVQDLNHFNKTGMDK